MPESDRGTPSDRVLPRSLKACGCYVRLPDYQAVMCAEHGAVRDARRAVERERRDRDAAARAARLPWNGPGGGTVAPALLFALFAVIGGAMWTTDADHQAAFDAGYRTTTAEVRDYHSGGRWFPSAYDIHFTAHDGTPVDAWLEDYDGEGPEVGGTVRIDYASADPHVVRTVGYDTADAVRTDAALTLGSAAVVLALLARLVTARAAARRAERPLHPPRQPRSVPMRMLLPNGSRRPMSRP